ncbi:MAG: BON domain-containing protein [Rickettsiales bacterium]|nr:BON domain-containing protein [Rickettsiales bacterium]
MNAWTKIGGVIMVALSMIGLNSCAPVVLGAGGVTAGVVGLQERTAGEAVDDTVIWTRIKNLYIQNDVNKLATRVSVEVTQGRVILTGNVPNPDARVEAVRLAWQVPGVTKVINEIQILNQQTIKSRAQDTWITTQVKSKLLLNKDIESINYSVDTVNQVVYLMGNAQNDNELKQATNIASTVKGVKRVVSHVQIKPKLF